MRSLMKTFVAVSSMVAMVSLGVTGCSDTVGDIDRTQPDKIHKSMFAPDKTWYFKQTVVDVPATAFFLFEGVGSDIFKVRWEVTKEALVAWRVHEHIPGMDPGAHPTVKGVGDTTYVDGFERGVNPEYYKESPVAAYSISSHFDIIRSYSSTTGEQSNVLVENTTDNPWFDREYMRVDWSSNLLDNYNLLDPSLSGAAHVISEGEEMDDANNAIHFETADGSTIDSRTDRLDERVSYFDFSNNWFMTPTYCFRGSPNNCLPEHVIVRSSFWRIDGRDQDYEPQIWDDIRQSKFGYFRTERFSYDRRRGFTDSGRIYLANRHRIWESAFVRNEDGSFERTASGDKVAIPIDDRVPRPVVYYLSPNFPEGLMDITTDSPNSIAAEWNQAFRRATAHACGVEIPNGVDIDAVPTAEAGDNCATLRANGQVPEMFRIDKNLDGQVRNGDLRRNFIYWVDQYQSAGPLGFGPSYADPETGELISGTAYVYGASVDSYAAYAMDIIDVLGGFLTLENLAKGEQVKAYIEANMDRVDPRRVAKRAAAAAGMSMEEYEQLDLDVAGRLLLPQKSLDTIDQLAEMGMPEGHGLFEQVQMDKLKGTRFEHMMLNDEIVNALAQGDKIREIAPDWKPGEPIPEDVLDVLSPTNWGYGAAMRDEDEEYVHYFASRNVLMAEFVDDSIIGLALEYQDQTDPEQVYQDLRGKIFKGVMLHEIGHTLGLRHNFEGSYDSTNFHDEYWSLRDENLLDLATEDSLSIDKLFEEARITENQRLGKMREFQYSSIMDYGMKFNSDVQGLGKYDHAAVIFGYSNGVEVFETERTSVLDNLQDYMLGLGYDRDFDFEGYLAATWENRTHPNDSHPLKHFNYTHMPYFLNGIEGIAQRRVVDYDELVTDRNAETPPADLPLEVPYMFCGDEWVNSIMSCNRWDEGANYYEINSAAISAYYNYYFFTHFRRDNVNFSPNSVMSRVYSRYFRLMSDTYRFGLFKGVFWGGLPDPVLRYLWQNAIVSGFDVLLNVVSTPEYGTYVKGNDNRYHHWKAEEDPGAGRVIVPMGLGRRRYTRYFWDEGYEYFAYPLESGHFWDYMAALMTLTESTFQVLGVEVQSNFRTYSIPYYLVFPDKLTRWFNGMALRDSDAYGPRVTANGEVRFMTDLSEDDKLDPEILPIDLRPNFTTQFYALIYGMQSFQSNYSLHYTDQMQVFREGGGESVDPGPGYDNLSFSDPITGHIYGTFVRTDAYDADGVFIGYKDENGEDTPTPPPVEIINELNDYRQRWEELPPNDRERNSLEYKMNDRVETLNILRGLYGIFGKNI